LNLTALSRLYSSERGYSDDQKLLLRDLAKRYAQKMAEKLQINDDR
jgi:hypothetical protein